MRRILFLLLGLLLACSTIQKGLSTEDALASISYDEFLKHLTTLSSDDMQGRDTGSPGYDSAAAYVVRMAEEIGLQPAGVDGTFFQPITFRKSILDGSPPKVSMDGEELIFLEDYGFRPSLTTTNVNLSAPVVFAGFGISAPEIGYDDYAGLDVAGKLVMYIIDLPESLEPFERTIIDPKRARMLEAEKRGALGVIKIVPQSYLQPINKWAFATQSHSNYLYDYVPPEGSKMRVDLLINYLKATELMKSSGRDYSTIYEKLLAGSPQSFEFGFEASVEVGSYHDDIQSPNVAALLPGTDPTLKEEILVMSAHLDHIGVGNPVAGDSIYNGTSDNASGSAALLTLAKTFSAMPPPKRSILFLWVTAEEKGLLGSEYWARFPTINPRQIVANHNIDMINGAFIGKSNVVAFGYPHSNLSEAADYATNELSIEIIDDPNPEENLFLRSDQYSFVKQGIPAIWLWGRESQHPNLADSVSAYDRWMQTHYHAASDDLNQVMSRDGALLELKTNFLMTHYIANEMESIRWNEQSFLYHHFGRKSANQLLVTEGQ